MIMADTTPVLLPGIGTIKRESEVRPVRGMASYVPDEVKALAAEIAATSAKVTGHVERITCESPEAAQRLYILLRSVAHGLESAHVTRKLPHPAGDNGEPDRSVLRLSMELDTPERAKPGRKPADPAPAAQETPAKGK